MLNRISTALLAFFIPALIAAQCDLLCTFEHLNSTLGVKDIEQIADERLDLLGFAPGLYILELRVAERSVIKRLLVE